MSCRKSREAHCVAAKTLVVALTATAAVGYTTGIGTELTAEACHCTPHFYSLSLDAGDRQFGYHCEI